MVTLVVILRVSFGFNSLCRDHSHDATTLLTAAFIAARTRKGFVYSLKISTIFLLLEDVTESLLMMLAVVTETLLDVIDVRNSRVFFFVVLDFVEVLELLEEAIVCECN